MIPFDVVFHLLVVVLFLAVFGEASTSKIFDRSTPDWFIDKYRATWMGRLPAPLLWWSIAGLELLVAVACVAALAEPFTGAMFWTSLALALAMLVFVILCFGLRVAQDYPGAASAFFYATLTALTYGLLDGRSGA